MEKGIDWSKENMYEGIGRPDLKPTECEHDPCLCGPRTLGKYCHNCDEEISPLQTTPTKE